MQNVYKTLQNIIKLDKTIHNFTKRCFKQQNVTQLYKSSTKLHKKTTLRNTTKLYTTQQNCTQLQQRVTILYRIIQKKAIAFYNIYKHLKTIQNSTQLDQHLQKFETLELYITVQHDTQLYN